MSSITFTLSSDISGKTSFHPIVGCFFVGLQVASYVAKNTPKAPDILSSSFASASISRTLDPTKTVVQPIDASISLPVAFGCSVAFLALLFAVFGLKGLFASNHDPPEPDDGSDDNNDDSSRTDTGNDSTDSGEEPPQPPSSDAATEASRKRRHWFILLLLQILRFLRQLFSSVWAIRWEILSVLLDTITQLEPQTIVNSFWNTVYYIGSTNWFWRCTTRFIQVFFGVYPWSDLHPTAVTVTDLLRQWWTIGEFPFTDKSFWTTITGALQSLVGVSPSDAAFVATLLERWWFTGIFPSDDLTGNEYFWSRIAETLPIVGLSPSDASFIAIVLEQWWITGIFSFDDLSTKEYFWSRIAETLHSMVPAAPPLDAVFITDLFLRRQVTGVFPWADLTTKECFWSMIATILQTVVPDAPLLDATFIANLLLQKQVTGVFPWADIHPVAPFFVDAFTGKLPLSVKIAATAVSIFSAAWTFHFKVVTAKQVARWLLWVFIRRFVLVVVIWRWLFNPDFMTSVTLKLVFFITDILLGFVGRAQSILSSGVEGLSPAQNSVLVGSTLMFYGCIYFGWPWTWHLKLSRLILL